MAEIRPCTVDDVFNSGLLDLYADECRMDGLPALKPSKETYSRLIEFGSMWIMGAWHDGNLVGFITVMVVTAHHYNRPILATESVFVHLEHRRGGTGSKLLEAAQDYARQIGAVGVIVSTPAGGRLSKVMSRKPGYRLSNEVYIWGSGCTN